MAFNDKSSYPARALCLEVPGYCLVQWMRRRQFELTSPYIRIENGIKDFLFQCLRCQMVKRARIVRQEIWNNLDHLP